LFYVFIVMGTKLSLLKIKNIMKSILILTISLFSIFACTSSRVIDEMNKLDKENSDLKSEKQILEEKLEEKSKYIEIYTDFVEEFDRELSAIDLGYIDIYSKDIEFQKKNALRDRLLDKVSKIKEMIIKNKELVLALKLTIEEVNRFKKIVNILEKKLENKKAEINYLTECNMNLLGKNIDLKRENLILRENIFKLRIEAFSSKDEVAELSNALKRERDSYKRDENDRAKYVIKVTNKDYSCERYNNSIIRLRGKNIKLLSKHTQDSFKVDEVINNSLCTLEILDQEQFWNKCNFLVIYYDDI